MTIMTIAIDYPYLTYFDFGLWLFCKSTVSLDLARCVGLLAGCRSCSPSGADSGHLITEITTEQKDSCPLTGKDLPPEWDIFALLGSFRARQDKW